MRKHNKVLLTLLCAVLLVVGSVMGTLAYLTDTDAVKNTFTVGKVGLKLDEAKVNEDGTVVAGAARVKENKYHLMPGHTYVKDPTVTIDADSEESYIRMRVEVKNLASLKAAIPQDKFPEFYDDDGLFLLQNLCVDENGALTWDGTKWEYEAFANDTYEFRYYKTVAGSDGELEPLFTKITVPGAVDNTQLANLENVEIVVTAHAIQKDGFNNAADAWAEFPTT